jgi:D-alanyl-D-alanine carboxypeptidase
MMATIKNILIKFIVFSFLSITPLVSVFANMSASVNLKIQNIVNVFRTQYGIPGMTVSISLPTKQTTMDFVSGATQKKGTIDITTGNLYQVGSITKSFTAAIILQLEADGRLTINNTLGKYLSQYPRWKEVTVKQLLNMTSGIFDYTHDKSFFSEMTGHPNKHWTPEQLINVAEKHPDYFKPGHGWHYSNTNYILAGMVIQKITGKTVAQEMNTRLLGAENLNLLNTYYSEKPYNKAVMARLVDGYNGDSHLGNVTNPNLSWAGAAGAIISNPRDIVRWVRALFSDNVLEAVQLKEMESLVCVPGVSKLSCVAGQPVANDVGGFGLGLTEMSRAPFGDFWRFQGDSLGYTTQYFYIPKFDLVIIVSINNKDEKNNDPLSHLMYKIVDILQSNKD